MKEFEGFDPGFRPGYGSLNMNIISNESCDAIQGQARPNLFGRWPVLEQRRAV